MVGDLDVAGFIVRVQKKADQTRKPFLVPPLVLYAVFVLAAFAQGIQISFTDWTGLTPGFHYVGLDNYVSLVQDSDWWRALEHNPILLIVVPVITLTLALLFASRLTRGGSGGARDGLPGSRFYRVLFFFPQGRAGGHRRHHVRLRLLDPVGTVAGGVDDRRHRHAHGDSQPPARQSGDDHLRDRTGDRSGRRSASTWSLVWAILVAAPLLWVDRGVRRRHVDTAAVGDGGLRAHALPVLRQPRDLLRLSHRADVPPLLSDRPAHEGRAEPASVREQARPDPDLCGVSLPFSVFFLTAFFQSLPKELAEAAFIDGAGHFGTFFGIMLPLSLIHI